MAIRGVVVAGGSSKRFGRNKLVEIVDGTELRSPEGKAAALNAFICSYED